jgi:chlorobactene glucosyltransferase
MSLALAATLPWLAALVFVRFRARFPTELPEVGAARDLPPVTVIVPARNEAHNIERCVGSLAASDYPDFEIVVMDDASDDGTGTLARAMPTGRARAIRVLDGEPLPEGWLGKPWACWQGARAAEGDVLLFTDADTVHAPTLLRRAILGMREERADLLTIMGRQLMETFWERLLQPHVFLGMLFRFPDFEKIAGNDRWRDAIANGQYILMPAASYRAVGGHEAVRDEVVEDLALAQHVKRAGMRLRIRSAEHGLSTRMYRSLGEIVAGWSKNLMLGGQQTFPRWMRPLIPPVSLAGSVLLWLVPPAVLAVVAVGVSAGAWTATAVSALLVWSALAVAASVLQFGWFTHRLGAPAWYGLLYPVGAGVTSFILARSWLSGQQVRWKGREYRVPAASARR